VTANIKYVVTCDLLIYVLYSIISYCLFTFKHLLNWKQASQLVTKDIP